MESSKKSDSVKISGVVTKSMAIKKFMKVSKQSSTTVTPWSKAKLVDLKSSSILYEGSMDDIRLKEKRDSQMHREMGVKHVRIKTPLQQKVNYIVQRQRPDSKAKRRKVGVLKPADPDSTIVWNRVPGPKLENGGSIIPHSILGDVTDFVQEANRRGEFQDILESQEEKKTENFVIHKPLERSSITSWTQLLNEEKALDHWNLEMCNRKLKQKCLAEITNRPVRDLLMTRSDDFMRRTELQHLIYQNGAGRRHPDVCFWTLQESFGTRQIITTLTRTERGHVKTPIMSGEGAMIIREKGKSYVHNSWHDSEYLKKQTEQCGGVIHIINSSLFKQLEVQGKTIYPPKQSISLTDSLSSDVQCEDGDKVTGHSKPVDVASQKNDSTMDRIVPGSPLMQSQNSRIQGPSLSVGGTTLCWQSKSKSEDNMDKNRLAKEVFILIEAKVGEIVKSYMTFENNGTIVLKYFWKKEAVFRPLPIPRPIRRPFYCFDDAGSIRPGEIIHTPVLFRSRIPGYFTESWLLDTVPILEGGANIRFTLKGVVRDVTDLSSQCFEIEEYLRKKQIETLCRLEANYIVDSAILKASLKQGKAVDEPITLTREDLFEELNPGIYFHEHIIKDLWAIFDEVSSDKIQKKRKSMNPVLCVSNLRNMIRNYPCPVTDDVDYHFDKMDGLFNTFCLKVMHLSFSPMFPWQPDLQKKQMIMYTLLQDGIDEFASRTNKLAETLGLSVTGRMNAAMQKVKQTKGKSAIKTRTKILATCTLSKGKVKEASPTLDHSLHTTNNTDDNGETVQFSPIKKFRQVHGSKCSELTLYEDRSYIMTRKLNGIAANRESALRVQNYLTHLYMGETLVALDRIAEGIRHLNPEQITDISTVPDPKTHQVNDKLQDCLKMKGSADDNIKIDTKKFEFSYKVENIVGQGEIARFEQFLHFPQCFQTLHTADT